MNISKLVLCLFAGVGTGCAMLPSSGPVAISDMPNCLESNYDKPRDLFTLNDADRGSANQKCLLTVVSRGTNPLTTRLTAGRYAVYFANGGGGGAGGTIQAMAGGGGGGGGGAGAVESRVGVELDAGVYLLTIGAGGPGGNACSARPFVFGGGPGWLGSPTNMVRVDSGTLIAGTHGADTYVRPKRALNEKVAGIADGHGGSGPGQTSGGRGASGATEGRAEVVAADGASKRVPEGGGSGGAAVVAADGASKRVPEGGGSGGAAGVLPVNKARPGVGGGGGATSLGDGGHGGGGVSRRLDQPPERGTLGSGGGGGEGNEYACDPGARGGHGYIALRAI